MLRFAISQSGFDSHEPSAEIARAILETSDREPSTIEVVGIEPLLTDHVDAASVDRLREAGLQMADGTLTGTVEATPETVEAVCSLFSDPLLVARFADDTGAEIFARSDSDAESCWLTTAEYERLCETLPFELATALRPSGDSVPWDQYGPRETDGLEAYCIGRRSEPPSPSVPSVLERHLDAAERDVDAIELFGSGPLLERVDADRVATLVDAGAARDGFTLVGTVPATSETIAAVLELLTDALFHLVVRDGTGQPLFYRSMPGLDYCYVTDAEYDRLVESVDSVTLEPAPHAP